MTLLRRIVKVNAGGQLFQSYLSTLKRYPDTKFAKLFDSLLPVSNGASVPEVEDVFIDASPAVFQHVLSFLRCSHMQLPVADEQLRAELVSQLNEWELMPYVFPAAGSAVAHGGGEMSESDATSSSHAEASVQLPDVCTVQLCDHLQHDQGVKRHAMTITYGADGFLLRRLTQMIRRDLNQQLSSTYWQCYQTNERAAFFATTKLANGAADILTTSITQQVVQHTESLGYRLSSSYVTLSPDVVHTSVRMFIHQFIFRRVRLPSLELSDEASIISGGDGDADDQPGGSPAELEMYRNFEPRHAGPQKVLWETSTVRPPLEQRSEDIWKP